MGNEYSLPPVSLVEQCEPICVTEPRYVLQHPVTLLLHERAFYSFSSVDFRIKCVQTGIEYFIIAGKAFSYKKTVRSSKVGSSVIKGFTSPETFYLYGGDNPNRKICKLHSKSGSNAEIIADFQDAISGRMRHVVLKGDWTNKQAVIYLGEPKRGGMAIANVNRQANIGGDDYYLEIAPGVDIALMVIMCIGLDIYVDKRKLRQIN